MAPLESYGRVGTRGGRLGGDGDGRRDKNRGARGIGVGGACAGHIDVDLLAGLTVARDAAEEEVVATAGDFDSVIACCVAF